MNFTERLLVLINKKSITKNKMLKDLGFGAGTFATWEKRGTIPNGETLSKLANYFNVTTDYLLGNENEQKETRPQLSERALEMLQHPNNDLKKLMNLFPQLPPERQQTIIDLLEAWNPPLKEEHKK